MPNINVYFFASLREELGVDNLSIELTGPISIEELKTVITDQLGAAKAFLDQDIQASIDFEFARANSIVDPVTVKEVAFFPPVTGG